ncbi:MAG: NADH:flavin oxidoreductase/NADH oxidase [Steroidobacteraceae bacterium]|nr:NADH:flavin oxidoreductase/NADH oxidase [Steroidobacteraceae bacterium]
MNGATGGPPALPASFTPLTVRSVTFRNRIVVSPMCQYAAVEGFVGAWHLAHHARFALGGVGGVLVEASGVTREGRITPGCLGIWADAHVQGLRQIVDLYRTYGIPVGIQLAHAGRKASAAVPLEGGAPLVGGPRAAEAWETVAPSPIPLGAAWPTPRALSGAEVKAIVAAFAAAARRAVEAGFDFVEIHAAHGYLVHSFLAPASNRRDDEWGGDAAGRRRFALAVADAVRRAVPDSMPVFCRVSSVDGVDGGVTLDDTIALARELRARGVDVLDCSSGGITGASGRASVPPSPGFLVPYARAVAHATGVTTMAVGMIDTPALVERVIAAGDAQLVAIGRQLLAEPSFAYRAAVELGHPDPESLLPPPYTWPLRRRRA